MSKRSKEKDIDVHYSTRVVIVGNAGVGKSALLGNLSRTLRPHIFTTSRHYPMKECPCMQGALAVSHISSE
jgi:ABC-type cobalamin/Fe3+-siderophores transport system ATPase subunit